MAIDGVVHAVLAHLGHTIQATFVQLFILLGPGLLLAAAMYYVAKAIRRHTSDRFDIYTTGWLGIPVHELGHALFCLIFKHQITKVELWQPDSTDGSLGFVAHSFNPDSTYQQIGRFFIGIGPITLGALVIYYSAHYLVGDAVFGALKDVHISSEAMSSVAGIKSLWHDVYPASLMMLRRLFSHDLMASWRLYAFLYIALAVGSKMDLSPPDIEGATQGFGALVGLLLVVNFVALFFGGISTDWFRFITSYYSVFYAVMLLTLIMNLLGLVAVVGWQTIGRGKPIAEGVSRAVQRSAERALRKK